MCAMPAWGGAGGAADGGGGGGPGGIIGGGTGACGGGFAAPAPPKASAPKDEEFPLDAECWDDIDDGCRWDDAKTSSSVGAGAAAPIVASIAPVARPWADRSWRSADRLPLDILWDDPITSAPLPVRGMPIRAPFPLVGADDVGGWTGPPAAQSYAPLSPVSALDLGGLSAAPPSGESAPWCGAGTSWSLLPPSVSDPKSPPPPTAKPVSPASGACAMASVPELNSLSLGCALARLSRLLVSSSLSLPWLLRPGYLDATSVICAVTPAMLPLRRPCSSFDSVASNWPILTSSGSRSFHPRSSTSSRKVQRSFTKRSYSCLAWTSFCSFRRSLSTPFSWTLFPLDMVLLCVLLMSSTFLP
mmetsp:Transcript_38565/g.86916  ORF Transcript_38565/g.86916 Transcript_38565/m.86916 type:complete len:359 (-) Transcript_38565:763-1839(-)